MAAGRREAQVAAVQVNEKELSVMGGYLLHRTMLQFIGLRPDFSLGAHVLPFGCAWGRVAARGSRESAAPGVHGSASSSRPGST